MPQTLNHLGAMSYLSMEDIEEKAKEVLTARNLTTIPIDPLTIAEKEKIEVNNAVFIDKNNTSMLIKHQDGWTLFVANQASPFRKRFAIAHNLGHFFLHKPPNGIHVDTETNLFRVQSDPSLLSPERQLEVQANLFAIALLMPADDVRRYWRERLSIEELARIFKVSVEAMGHRVASLGLG